MDTDTLSRHNDFCWWWTRTLRHWIVISYWCCCGDVDGIVVDDGGCDCIGSWTRSSHGFELWIVVTDNGGHRNLVYAWRSRHRQEAEQ
ncbi:pollen-specific leucine-rich repeat extensin-like protein 3 [Iris pallida]|uniref:Pollen-specific leucine-rich repeat extensin-like protein 3 n=1 Tax=Iris pallida TaxID=29817 RepID=A0AAX6G2T4_IRIPA|nr:pollen-specific leucine-rich repeat extensin-like protein 3 [Iris pallida]